MTGEQHQAGSGGHEDVGSLGEEAAKLLGALSHWARDQAEEGATADGDRRGSAPLDDVLAAAHRVDGEIATGSAECRWCPVCRVVHAVRQTSPEVREHLAAAAGSLLEAASGLLATHVPADHAPGSDTGPDAGPGAGPGAGPETRSGPGSGGRSGGGSPLERIDLDSSAEEWGERPDGPEPGR